MGIRPVEVVLIATAGGMITAILYPVFASARRASTTTSCISHAKEMALALIMYSADQNDRLPQGKNWTAAVESFSADRACLSCPLFPGVPYAYALHKRAAGASLTEVDEPGRRVMTFESAALIRNLVADEALLPSPGRHDGLNIVSFVDGQARMLASRDTVAWPPVMRKEITR